MKILLDTNIVMDVIEKRKPYYKDAVALLKAVSAMEAECYFSASSAKDVFYLVKRHTGSLEKAKKAQTALLSSMADFEDAILVSGAERENMDFVVTRNEKDFANATVKVITPTEFLGIYS